MGYKQSLKKYKNEVILFSFYPTNDSSVLCYSGNVVENSKHLTLHHPSFLSYSANMESHSLIVARELLKKL